MQRLRREWLEKEGVVVVEQEEAEEQEQEQGKRVTERTRLLSPRSKHFEEDEGSSQGDGEACCESCNRCFGTCCTCIVL